jgi:tetratricopeptide (TPR) repeat protein
MDRKHIALTLVIVISTLGLCGCFPANHIYKNAYKAWESGSYEKAETLVAQAIEINPDRAEFYLLHGCNLMSQGQYAQAIAQFERAMLDKDIVMIMENNKRALRLTGIAYFAAGDYDSAMDVFNRARDIRFLPELNADIDRYLDTIKAIMGK